MNDTPVFNCVFCEDRPDTCLECKREEMWFNIGFDQGKLKAPANAMCIGSKKKAYLSGYNYGLSSIKGEV